jgi:hypothetical protein
MESLTYSEYSRLNTRAWVRMGDLFFFEGPLLSLFQDLNSRHFYVFDWVDRDMKANRWMIYRVSPECVSKYINGEISHHELFENRPANPVYFMDIDSRNKNFSEYGAFELNVIPSDYIPLADNYFDESDSNSLAKIKSVISRAILSQKNENEYPEYIDTSSVFASAFGDNKSVRIKPMGGYGEISTLKPNYEKETFVR